MGAKEARHTRKDLELTLVRYEWLLRVAKVTDLVYMYVSLCLCLSSFDGENELHVYLGLDITHIQPPTAQSADMMGQGP